MADCAAIVHLHARQPGDGQPSQDPELFRAFLPAIAERTGITALLNDLSSAGVRFNDLNTTQSSLEEIFVSLVHQA